MLTKRTIACLGIAAVLVLGSIAFKFAREAVNVDACLDQGGSFDYEATRCDTEASHTFVSYSTRHPLDGLLALGALVFGAVSATMYMRK